MSIQIRTIDQKDDVELAELIRCVFREFRIDKPGTVYTDPTTDKLSEVFKQNGSVYFLAEENGILLGGCGIYPTAGLPEGCVELVKFYLSSASRGLGLGKLLMKKSIEAAQHFGYNQIYLESFPELSTAIGMYQKAGFKLLSKPLGNSGHFACNVWMELIL